jgi:hypothetical protein
LKNIDYLIKKWSVGNGDRMEACLSLFPAFVLSGIINHSSNENGKTAKSGKACGIKEHLYITIDANILTKEIESKSKSRESISIEITRSKSRNQHPDPKKPKESNPKAVIQIPEETR